MFIDRTDNLNWDGDITKLTDDQLKRWSESVSKARADAEASQGAVEKR
jgi:hypothetical protein